MSTGTAPPLTFAYTAKGYAHTPTTPHKMSDAMQCWRLAAQAAGHTVDDHPLNIRYDHDGSLILEGPIRG